MYFEAGYKAVVLFEGWNVDSVGAMVGSCIGVFLMAILYEGLKYFRYFSTSLINYGSLFVNRLFKI